MKRGIALVAAVALVIGVVGATVAHDNSQRNAFKAHLIGYQETPSISSAGSGDVRITVDPAGTTLSYTLTYSGLVGAEASHIHFGQTGVAGGVAAFLCGGGGKPACPASSGTVTGTVVASDIIGPTAQGISAGDFAALLRAMRAGYTYVNVHTAAHPAGEIRGQLRAMGK